jgi:hypothetical protein
MEGTESDLGRVGIGCVVVAAATAGGGSVTGAFVVVRGAITGGGGADANCWPAVEAVESVYFAFCLSATSPSTTCLRSAMLEVCGGVSGTDPTFGKVLLFRCVATCFSSALAGVGGGGSSLNTASYAVIGLAQSGTHEQPAKLNVTTMSGATRLTKVRIPERAEGLVGLGVMPPPCVQNDRLRKSDTTSERHI